MKSKSKSKSKRSYLGEITSNADFVQGGNQLQTFLLIGIISMIVLFFVSQLPKLFDKITNKNKKEDDEDNYQTGSNKIVRPNGTATANKESIPSGYNDSQKIQWLLKKAGYYTGSIINERWRAGSEYDLGLQKWLKDTGTPNTSTNQIINDLSESLRNKGVLNGARLVPIKKIILI